MHIKLSNKLVLLLVAIPIISLGCQRGQLPSPSTAGEPSLTPVSDTQPAVYVYARQDSPTRIPAWLLDPPCDMEAESLALWGVPSEDKSALGMALTLTSASDASRLYDGINLEELYATVNLDELHTTINLEKLYSAVNPEEGVWKMLSGKTIYLVYGSGAAAESLKTDISNHDFKYHNYCESLEAVAALPSHGATKPAAIAIAKPSEALIAFIAKYADTEYVEQIDMILKLGNIKAIAVGLYSPHQIDIADMAGIVRSDSFISNLNLGLLISVQSGLPGFLVAPAVKKLLTDYGFTEMKFGEFTLYEKAWYSHDGEGVPVLVWIKGNNIFAAIAGQESYAQALISSTIASVNR